MPRPRFQTVDPALRIALFDAATREFGQRGYEAASLNQIIEAAGLSKGSFYYYFDDKADLAATVFADAAHKLSPPFAELEAASDRASFWRALQRYNDQSIAELAQTPALLQLVAKLGVAISDHPEFAARINGLTVELATRFVAACARGQAFGAIRNDLPMPLLSAIVQSVKEVLARAYLKKDAPLSKADLEHFAALNWNFVQRLLSP